MDFFSDRHQAPSPRWTEVAEAASRSNASQDHEAELIKLRERIRELEDSVDEYEALLAELPEMFERKFQQRLEPLLERYRLLADAEDLHEAPAPLPEQPLKRISRHWAWPKVRQLDGTSDNDTCSAA